jgi:hypothetical protein
MGPCGSAGSLNIGKGSSFADFSVLANSRAFVIFIFDGGAIPKRPCLVL